MLEVLNFDLFIGHSQHVASDLLGLLLLKRWDMERMTRLKKNRAARIERTLAPIGVGAGLAVLGLHCVTSLYLLWSFDSPHEANFSVGKR